MKLINVSLVLVLSLSGAMLPQKARAHAWATEAQSSVPLTAAGIQRFRKGEVIVEIKPGASIEAINARHGTTTIQWIYGTNFYRLLTPKGKKQKKWRKKLSKDADVLSASLNPVVTSPSLFGRSTAGFPDGFAKPELTFADFDSQLELFDLLNLDQVNLRSRGAGTVVAVVDTGIDFSHPVFAGRLWQDDRPNADLEGDGIDNDEDGLIDDARGWDFVDNDNDPSEKAADPETTVAGHGTFIAGLITMLAPDCRILPIRAFPPEGMSDAFTVAAAVKYAADHGADVINLSLGSPDVSPLLEDAINYASERGAVLVAAVGNENSEMPAQYPSSSPDVMAIAAIDLSSHKAAFSNYGRHVDLSAPGANLISAYPGGGEAAYASWSGTSFAAPLASAEAALVLSVDARSGSVKSVVEGTAINIDEMNPGFAGKLGKGRINPLGALRSLNVVADAVPASDIRSQIELSAGPTNRAARGKASFTITNAGQEFTAEFHNLSVRAGYKLFVNGEEIGSEVSANLGNLIFRFSTGPDARPLPPSLSPVTGIRRVELRDSLSRIVLQGDFAAAGGGTDPAARVFEKDARLISTDALSQTGGRARVSVKGDHQRFAVEAEGLLAGETYRLVVDGIVLVNFVAQFDFARAVFANDGTGQPLPLPLLPVTGIRHVELQNGRGQIVLQGDFRNAP
ncbi:MAG: S8 family serine peptidase [Blastocatellia bacterium]|nr:S8 family serine peptidase [Blastocatellia bacterium]